MPSEVRRGRYVGKAPSNAPIKATTRNHLRTQTITSG